MGRRKAVLGCYAALRCLWHAIHVDERTNKSSSCAVRVALVQQYKQRGAGSTLVRTWVRKSSTGGGGAGP
eukprot:4375773-Prymnesium_polylepis.1